MIRWTEVRLPGRFHLGQDDSQGRFLCVDSLERTFSQGYFHVGACARAQRGKKTNVRAITRVERA